MTANLPCDVCNTRVTVITYENSLGIDVESRGGLRMKQCVDCPVMIEADVWAEELGMCLDCSSVYWTHDDEEQA